MAAKNISYSKQLIPNLCSLLLFIVLAFPLQGDDANGESTWRTWTSTVNTTIEARLVKVHSNSVVLEKRNGRQLTVPLSRLVEQDRRFIAAMPPAKGNTQIEGLNAIPTIISEPISCINDSAWSYHLYLPKDFHDGRQWPVWFIMSPVGAKFMDDLRRYIHGAEQLGCILAFSVESRNGFPDSEIAVAAMIEDVFDRLPVTPGLAFTTGFSGGSRMAYLIAERDRRIAGVLACGSGCGVYPKGERFRRAELRENTYVYSLIGTNCCNRTGATKSHLEFPDDYRLRFFPGYHDWASSRYLSQGMARVLGSGLERKQGSEYEHARLAFAQTMLDWAKLQIETTPWETCYWANYLKDFPSSNAIENEARLLEKELEANPRVQLAAEADKELLKFIKGYFTVEYKEDQLVDMQRKKDGERLAEKYKDLPQGTLFRRFTEPCSY